MYILNEQIHYQTWQELWEKGYRSRHFHAGYTPESFRNDLPLSERLLFTQSNARVLLGQDSTGRLAFLAAPHEKDYPIPTCTEGRKFPITACPGMFYQTDMAMWFGRAEYVIELDDGACFPAMDENADTWYHEHFLPCGETRRNGLKINVVSVAPVLEKNAWHPHGIQGTPLPGPSGALYTAYIENTTDKTITGKCSLRFERKMVIRSEYTGSDPFEADQIDPYFCAWERKVYTMFHPGCSVSLALDKAVVNDLANAPEMYVPICLKPGQSMVAECRIAVSPVQEGLSGALAQLYQHSTLEWINVTADFWKERLGNLKVELDAPEEISEKYMEFQIRNILDDFNCLQTDANGRLLVHWQGAPSHNIGRFWGIDIEPTVNSVLYAVPELGPSAIEYIAERNEPAFSLYTDHSTPIRVALPIIAAKYLELTGDADYFRKNQKVMDALRGTFERVMASKHADYALFSSRYSSDGIVFHRYDVGTNVKVWLALRGYHEILTAVGESCDVNLPVLCDQIKKDMLEQLTEEGPFGVQLTGGKTFGEDREFYFRDDMFYYDGEDSTSCMMPVYGVCDFNEPAWVNYHRFARSLFCPNYDPEMGALRWFFYGGAVDGTAYISRMGGAVTRSEMRAALIDMIDCDLDLTGSLYWWPKGKNKRRCIARCSQGQGSWVIQGTEQWLGLHLNALTNTLEIRPQGLVRAYSWEGAKLGGYLFDIDWSEDETGTKLTVVNKNATPVNVRVGVRPQACGCDGELAWFESALAAGETLQKRWDVICADAVQDVNIPAVEAKTFGKALFGSVGLQMPGLEQKSNAFLTLLDSAGPQGAEQKMNAFLMRWVFVPEKDCEALSVRVETPEKWGIIAKTPQMWSFLTDVNDACAEHTGKCAAGERFVAPFFIRMPAGLAAANVWSNVHPFMVPHDDRSQRLLVCGSEPASAAIRARLTYRDADGEHVQEEILPVDILCAEAFEKAVHEIKYGI